MKSEIDDISCIKSTIAVLSIILGCFILGIIIYLTIPMSNLSPRSHDSIIKSFCVKKIRNTYKNCVGIEFNIIDSTSDVI